MNTLLCGIDVGTTGTKAVFFSLDGGQHGAGYADYSSRYSHPGWAEQYPEEWWTAVCKAIKLSFSQTHIEPERIKGVAVCSQAPTLLPLDHAGRPVRPAILWMDRRAEKEAIKLKELLGENRITQVTGNRSDAFYLAAKLLWFVTNEKSLFCKTRKFVQANGFINFKLTEKYCMDRVHTGLLQLMNWKTNQWSKELFEACNVEPDFFPPIYPCTHIMGEVTARAAEETGIPKGTPVMAGMPDGAAAALEAGAVKAGTAAEMTGTSTVLLMPHDGSVLEPAFILIPHIIPGIYLSLGAMAASGASLRWFRDQFGMTEISAGLKLGLDPYNLLSAQASQILPGCEGVIFLPYMMGERSPLWHTNARGVFFGMSLATSRGAMIRAILEGVAFALRHNVDVAEKAKIKIGEIRSVGGGARSSLWNQIKADILGLPVLVPRTNTGGAGGAAMVAGIGLGLFKNIDEALGNMIQINTRFEPDKNNHRLYNELYRIFRDIYHNLREDFDRIAAVRERIGNKV